MVFSILEKKFFPQEKKRFIEKFENIKKCVRANYEMGEDFELKDTSPGNYWAINKVNGTLSNNGWYQGLQDLDGATAYSEFRRYVNENLSGSPFGDYSQLQGATEEQLLSNKLIAEYFEFIKDIPAEYHIQEPHFEVKQQWGVTVKGKQLSANINRYQRYIANLYKLGILQQLRKKAETEKVFIVEIGSGFASLAEHLYSIFSRNVKYIIVDLPHMLGLAATYLAILKPDLKQAFFDPSSQTGIQLSKEVETADVIFLPHYAAHCLLDLPQIDLAFNSFSFQEMAEENIHYYSQIISKVLNGYLYSDNFRRHPHNFSLKSKVGDILRQHFYVFPRNENYYDAMQNQLCYQWQTYIHVATSKAKPVFLTPSTDYSDFIWGENYKLQLTTGECLY